tara:strand:- start:8825 stop:10792 length:1968 start_codon:yes stop_codon:yes gene_type:complete
MSTPSTQGAQPTPEHAAHDDDFIVAPPGRSKAFYIFVLALMVFVLIIFSIGDLAQYVLGGGGADQAAIEVTWIDPITKKKHEVNGKDYREAKLDLDCCMGLNIWTPLSAFAEDDDPNRGIGFEPEDVVLLLTLEQLAIETGIEVSNREFSDRLSLFVTDADLENIGNRFRRNKTKTAAGIRRVMRAANMRTAILQAANMFADPAAVEAAWKEANPEYRFEYIETKISDWEEVAKESAPPDADLKAWYDGLQEFQKRQFYSDAMMQVALAYVPMPAGADSTFDATALLAKYPKPDAVDLAASQELYYNLSRATRFVIEPDPPYDPESGDPAPPLEFQALEDVRETVNAEAAIYNALGEFLKDVRTREADVDAPDVDWVAEATALGLTVEQPTASLSTEQIVENETWGGQALASRLSFSPKNSMIPNVQVHKGALVIARLLDRVDPAPQDMFLIKDEVVDAWAKEEARRLAVQRFNVLRDMCADRPLDDNGTMIAEAAWSPVVDSETLREQADIFSMTVTDRAWRGRRPIAPDDATDLDTILAEQPTMFDLEPGMLPQPGINRAGTHAYLIHLVETREAPLDQMLPVELLNGRRTELNTEAVALMRDVLHPRSEWFQAKFQLNVPSWDEEAEEEPAGAGSPTDGDEATDSNDPPAGG